MPSSVVAQHFGIEPASPEQAVLQLLIELAAQIVGAEEGSLLVLDRTQDPARELVFAMTVGSRESEGTLAGQRVPVGEGLTGLAALSHEVQIGSPTYEGVRQAERGEAAAGQPSAVIAAPMLVGDTLVGVITAVSFAPGKRFTPDDAKLYARAASVAGVVVGQRQQLDSLEPAAQPSNALPANIADPIARILGKQPEAAGEIASLLAALEGLVGGRRG